MPESRKLQQEGKECAKLIVPMTQRIKQAHRLPLRALTPTDLLGPWLSIQGTRQPFFAEMRGNPINITCKAGVQHATASPLAWIGLSHASDEACWRCASGDLTDCRDFVSFLN